MYIKENLNPLRWQVGDCVVRAIAKVLNQTWNRTYIELCAVGLSRKDMPTSNAVWSEYLRDNGYTTCNAPYPDYTVRQFADDHPAGRYVAATGTHAVAVVNGDFYDTWYSGDEIVTYYFAKEGF